MTACTVDGTDGAVLCLGCWAKLAGWLREVPWLVGELETTITRQDKLSRGRTGGRSAEAPLMFNDRASQARVHARDILGSRCRDVADREGVALPTSVDRDTTSDAALWLLDRRDDVRYHPAAVDLYAEVVTAVRDMLRAIDLPPDRVFTGWCDCGTILWAKPGRELVRCRECLNEYGVAESREAMLAELEPRRFSAIKVAEHLAVLGVTVQPNTIVQWYRRGKIERDRYGKYRVGDVVKQLSTLE